MPRFTRLALTAASLALFAFPSMAQTPPEPPLPEGQTALNIAATEHAEVQQDQLTASLSVEKQNADPVALQNDINTIMQKAIAAAKDVKEVQISTDQYYVYPVDPDQVVTPLNTPKDRKPQQRIWRGSQGLTLKSAQADAVLRLAAQMQTMGMNMTNLSYILSPDKEDATRDALMERALAKVQQRADRAAKALGKSKADLVEVNVDSAYNPPGPRPVMMRAMAMSAAKMDVAQPSAEPGMTDIDLTVNARAILKP